MDTIDKIFLIGVVSVVGIVAGSVCKVLLETSYYNGVRDTYNEAYKNGHMVKEITKDDKVAYRWKHLEKIGYEETN